MNTPRCEDCKHFHSDTEIGHGLCGAYEIDGPANALVQRNDGWLMARLRGRCGWEGRWFKPALPAHQSVDDRVE